MAETRDVVTEGNTRSLQVRSSFRRSAQGREIVVVLGMYRSGASLLANVLHLLGVDMLDAPPQAAAGDTVAAGAWERPEFAAIHDEILEAVGVPVGSPAHAGPFPAGWWRAVELQDQKKRLRDLLAGHLSEVRRPWGFKDPRTCRLLPLWGEILEELDVSPRFVWAVRHPAEAAQSTAAANPSRRPIAVPQAEVMWLAYNYDILRYAGRHSPIIVPYDQWFENPLALAKDLAFQLDLVWQSSEHELEMSLGEVVQRGKRRHWAAAGRLKCMVGLSEDIYNNIVAVRHDPERPLDEASAVSLHSVLTAVQPFARMAADAEEAAARAARRADDAERASAEADGLRQQMHREARDLEASQASLLGVVEGLRRQVEQSAETRQMLDAALAAQQARNDGIEGDRNALREQCDRIARDLVARQAEFGALRVRFDALSQEHEALARQHEATAAALQDARSLVATLKGELLATRSALRSEREAAGAARLERDLAPKPA
jgi:hypothetical protein